ncbi:MAG TPA: molybdenum cofactor guanylyltransferase [Chthoniobacterales bacterium]
MRELSAALIAGGRSTRMGLDKAWIPIDGEPLWRHQLVTLRALEPAEVFLCGAGREDLTAPDMRGLLDEEPDRGPLGGLAAALATSSEPFVIALAVDLPAMTPGFLVELADEAAVGGMGIVPELDGFYQGLAAVYPRALADCATRLAADEDHSLQHFIREGIAAGLLRARQVRESERGLFANWNEPRDIPRL